LVALYHDEVSSRFRMNLGLVLGYAAVAQPFCISQAVESVGHNAPPLNKVSCPYENKKRTRSQVFYAVKFPPRDDRAMVARALSEPPQRR